MKKDYQAAWLINTIRCIDLTTLAGDDTPGRVRRLCAKARQPLRPDLVEALGIADLGLTTAAVCVYPTMVPHAVAALEGSGLRRVVVAGGVIPAQDYEVLYKAGASAIRGGVPICFPWFGPGRDGNLSPSHGPVRLTEWEPLDVQRDGDDVRLTFGLTAPVARSIAPDAPYPAVGLSYVVTLGRELDLALTIHALADADVEAALHTYLAVEDVRTTSIAGLEGASYLDKVTGDETGPQEGAVRFAGETDRVYDASGTVALDDGARRVSRRHVCGRADAAPAA